ncbi:hypothetical protein DH2020_031950 [Rehmannia glutinosa]|uniref:RING-CH-type domain-containing protein n=1 Tax=Rehmannia glutinosa TaxID=99300 RepID=A0ABR0VGM7_REHGL
MKTDTQVHCGEDCSSDEPTVCREYGDPRAERIEDESEEKTTTNGDCSIDVKESSDDGSRKSQNSKAEKVCRICHFCIEPSSGELELIALGCDCKGELGSPRQHCAQAWFGLKGDSRLCEICGKTADNIRNINSEETSIFVMEWNEMRLVPLDLDNPRESSCRCKRSFYNLVLGCLVLAFLLLWFFRGINVL